VVDILELALRLRTAITRRQPALAAARRNVFFIRLAITGLPTGPARPPGISMGSLSFRILDGTFKCLFRFDFF